MLPESSELTLSIHHVKTRYISTDQVQAAMTIVISYIFIFVVGAVLGAGYGYPFTDALFESVSAGANVGLSVGLATPAMPQPSTRIVCSGTLSFSRV